MNLTSLMGSPWPNVIALALVTGALVFALALRCSTYRWGFVLLEGVTIAAILAKNVNYSRIISGPHAENSLAAHHSFALALLGVAIAQVGVVVGLLIVGVVAGTVGWRMTTGQRERSAALAWLSGAAAAASANAAVSTLDWRQAYLNPAASQPVRYVMTMPWLHWVLVVALVATFIVAITLPIRRQAIH